MNGDVKKETDSGNFHLSKWFLDFTGENGEAMIFYAAELKWHGWSVTYTSWLNYDSKTGVNLKSRFRNVNFPKTLHKLIIWKDIKFGISGRWKSMEDMIQCRIFDSEEGFLDWHCFQPASEVQIKINSKILKGKGYVEQLILTVPPWKIPMDELRWGRFISDESTLVWIEYGEERKQHWLWMNGEKIQMCLIKDDQIIMPDKNLVLNLDRSVILESEKKIFSLVGKLIKYIPGFNKVMPLNFIMADEIKWLSKGELKKKGEILTKGMAIHEFVNFKPIYHGAES